MAIPFPKFEPRPDGEPPPVRVDPFAVLRKDLLKFFDRRNPRGGWWNRAAALVAASVLLDPVCHDDPWCATRMEAERRFGSGRVAEVVTEMVVEAL